MSENIKQNEKEKIVIFDTTLRDGEQAPGASMKPEEKLLIATALEKMGVDVIEAGFPISSEGNFSTVKKIAQTIKNSTICALARAKEADIRSAAEALAPAANPRIHTFIATSPIHMQYKLKMDKSQVLDAIKSSVSLARNFVGEISWSAEDSTRSERDFLFKAIETAIEAGANTINIPDTVGYAMPEEIFDLITQIKNKVKGIEKATISMHCHNDLGLSVANSLAGVRAGARQVECTINGIGERAGNAALEEVVMALTVRPDFYGFRTDINTKMITRTSKLVSTITGFVVQNNKAIVGANAFAHESGIHQDGFLKNRETYEIMTPESVGLDKSSISLGKLSGRAAFKSKVEEMQIELSEEKFEEAFKKLKDLADKKKSIEDEDIVAIIDDVIVEGKSSNQNAAYELIAIDVKSSTGNSTEAEVKIKIDNTEHQHCARSNDGPVNAIFSAIDSVVKHEAKLDSYQLSALTEGHDAQAAATVRLRLGNRTYTAKGLDTDVLFASALAYVNCLNRLSEKNRL